MFIKLMSVAEQVAAEMWINPDAIRAIKFLTEPKLASLEYFDGTEFVVTHTEARRIIEIIDNRDKPVDSEMWRFRNPMPPAADVPAANVRPHAPGEINRIERAEFYSKTSGEYRPMWRMNTLQGRAFNVFDHADELRNTFKLFQDVGFGDMLQGMALGDVLTFNRTSITVQLEADGQFWKPIRVLNNGEQPDAPTAADDEPSIADAIDAVQSMTNARVTSISVHDGVMSIRTAPETDDDPGDDDPFYSVIRSGNFVVLDTETTGLEKDAEICQIAIIDSAGKVLLDTLVKPRNKIPDTATAIHGITNAMVSSSPNFINVAQAVWDACQGKTVIVYNADYDFRLLAQSEYACEPIAVSDWDTIARQCAMLKFAEVYGDWNDYRQSYRWQKLETAARHYRLPVEAAHSALGDCKMTLALVKAMLAAKDARHE